MKISPRRTSINSSLWNYFKSENPGKLLEIEEAINYTIQIAVALNTAYKKELIHRHPKTIVRERIQGNEKIKSFCLFKKDDISPNSDFSCN